MPFETHWHIEKRVIGSRFYDNVTESELTAHGIGVEQLILTEGIQPLFMIVDTRDIVQYPTHLKDVLSAMNNSPTNRTHLSYTFVITDSKLVNFIGTIASNVFKTPLRACKTLEEAESFVAHYAPELGDALKARKANQHSDSAAS
jgi:hypothetical protein